MSINRTALNLPDEDYETIKANFEALYHNHPEIYDVFATQQITQSELLDQIEQTLKDNGIESGDFLDIGCGTGAMIAHLAPRLPKINFIGIDPARNSLELAKQKCAGYTNTTFRSGTIEQLERTENAFDVVFSSWGHIHWNEKGGIMEYVAKPDGLAMLVNNWGEEDDFSKLWPESALTIHKTRREILQKNHYQVSNVVSEVNLDDENLFDAMSRLFGQRQMYEHRTSPFQIGIVLAWKKITV